MLLICELLALYLRHSAVDGTHGRQALAERQSVFDLFNTAYGTIRVAEAKSFMLTEWIDAHEGWRSVSTRRAKATMVKAAFQWAVESERIARNPFARVRYPEAERRPDLPDRLLDQLAAVASKGFERVIRFLRFTGCRTGELCRARWCDFDLERGIWTIPAHKTRKTTRKAKVIALVPEAVALLRAMAAARAIAVDASVAVAEGAIPARLKDRAFLNARSKPWSPAALANRLVALKRKCGITDPATLHGIRHRFGSAAVANGAPIKLVSAQLGHASVITTERYYVCLDGEIEAIRAAAALSLR